MLMDNMDSDSSTDQPDTDDRLPDAIERLAASGVDQTKVPDVITLARVIVRLRLDNSVIILTRSRVEAEFESLNASSTTISNRLKTLVEEGVLAVDTTGDAHRFTLAVPCPSGDVPIETWKSEIESFTPTTWDGIEPKEPAHAAIESYAETTRWEATVDPEQWPVYGRPTIAGSNRDTQPLLESKRANEKKPETTRQSPVINSTEPPCVATQSDTYTPIAEHSANQYAQYGAIARKITAGLGVSVIVAGGLLGESLLALAVIVLALFAFSAWVVLGMFGSITDRWRDPADARPADIVDRLDQVV